MLIVSNFHDYYDTSAVHGIDKTVVYDRITSELSEDPNTYTLRDPRKHYSTAYTDLPGGRYNGSEWSTLHIVGFCGKLYVCLEHHLGVDTKYYWGDDAVGLIKDGVKPTGYKRFKRFDRNRVQQLCDWITSMHGRTDLSLFVRHRVPAFVYCVYSNSPGSYSKRNLTINPRLSDIGFQKIRGSAEAFSDIYGFIGGVLGVNDREIVVVSDKDKLASRGFDPTWSFRNPDPPKRKQKK